MAEEVSIIAGGYLGDEGKGKATQFFIGQSDKRALCVRSTGGTNTGATIHRKDGTKISVHMVPVGIFMDNCDGYIGNGAYLNIDKLCREFSRALDAGFEGYLFISRYAHIVKDLHILLDREKEEETGFGSTCNGVSVAASYKYSYKGTQLKDCESAIERIEEFANRIRIIDPWHFFQNHKDDYHIVIEGTQGVGLDINNGFQYPYVSAGSFSTNGLLDGVGYGLKPTKVVMVLKTYGSYFGYQNMPGEMRGTHAFRDFAGEYGTTTKRPRKLCWLDTLMLRKASNLIQPDVVFLNRFDTLNWFPENNQVWKLYIDGGEEFLYFEDRAVDNGKITNAGQLFIEAIEEACSAPVGYIGVGPKPEDTLVRC